MKMELIKTYLKLVESHQTDETSFDPVLHPDFEQVQLPNSLNPQIQTNDRAEIFRRLKVGKTLIAVQKFEIQKMIENGDFTSVESIWTATMAADAGALKAGKFLKAYFCMIFEFKDGKIFRQRNYGCFEPIY